MNNRANLRLNLDSHVVYADPRTTGPDLGRTRNVRLYRATPSGGGAISKHENGRMCAVTGKESLRIISVNDGSHNVPQGHKSSVGKGGYRIDASKNFWEGSGLKIDCASTDVAWGWGSYNNKIMTSSRNGELILWDINKTETSKFEKKCRDHIRSINAMCVSHIVHHYCITGSSDGDLRVWDLRSFERSILRVHHPAAVRSLAFSPSLSHPFYAIVGQDNGSIWRWDLSMGQRGCLDRLPVAHSGSVTSLDWCNRLPASYTYSHLHPPLAIPTTSHSHASLSGSGSPDPSGGSPDTSPNNGLGWLASGGLDRCVKVWDLTSSVPQTAGSTSGPGEAGGKIRNRPTYTLHPSFPVRRVIWRPEYECELAIVSHAEFTPGSNPDLHGQGSGGIQSSSASHFANAVRGGTETSATVGSGATRLPEVVGSRSSTLPGVSGFGTESRSGGAGPVAAGPSSAVTAGDAVEIWDVRRGWIAKWSVTGSAAEGSVTDLAFGSDSESIWTQHSSGAFSQIDLRDCKKPIDSIPRTTATWDTSGSLTFVASSVTKQNDWGIPYDDIPQDKRPFAERNNIKLKAIGDPRYTPRGEQDIGTLVVEDVETNAEVFERLAKGYAIWGDDENGPLEEQGKRDRVEVCKINAQVAFDAKQVQIAQTWLLLGASLSESAVTPAAAKKAPPKAISRSDTPAPVSSVSPPLPASNYNFPPSANSQPILPSQLRKVSPSGHGNSAPVIPPPPARSTSNSVSRSRRMTPVSSTQSSPRQLPITLPPLPNITPRRPSIFSRPSDHSSADIDLSRRSSISTFRRPSFSVHGSHSLSPAERASNAGGVSVSLRHVGEGALDDSDSDEEEEGSVVNSGTVMDGDGGNDSSDGFPGYGNPPLSSSLFQPGNSPSLHTVRSSTNIPTPSPLSRVAGQQRWSSDESSQRDGASREEDGWAPGDDEDEDTSPSPRSTGDEAEFDADSDDNDNISRPAYARTPTRARSTSRSKRGKLPRSRSRKKTRPRRSSTVALLAAAGTSLGAGSRAMPGLARQDSESSIRTVLAGDMSGTGKDNEALPRSLALEETFRDMRDADRRRSIPFSDFALDGSISTTALGNRGASLTKASMVNTVPKHVPEKQAKDKLTERRIEIVRADEQRFRNLAFDALREALDAFADEGNVQMCAMLSLTAHQELCLSPSRVRRFLESYIDLLQRRRLYACAAHIRKFCNVEAIRDGTLVETIIYTACGRCRKPLAGPQGNRSQSSQTRVPHAYCEKCRAYAARCMICRLPIRTLSLQCAICHHGAHQECYRDYHLQTPPANVSNTRVHPATSSKADRNKREIPAGPQAITNIGNSISADMARKDFRTLGRLCAGGCGHHCWLSLVEMR